MVNFTVLDLEAQATSMDDIDDEEEDKEDDQDICEPTPEPNGLDEDTVESDLELDEEGIVQSDHDGVPQKVMCSALLASFTASPPQ